MTTFTQMCIIKQLGLVVKSFFLCFYTKTTSKRTLKTIFIFDKFYSTRKLWKYQNKNLQVQRDFTVFLDQFSPYIENSHNTEMHYAGNLYHKICN